MIEQLIESAKRILAALLELLRRAVDAVLAAWRSRGFAPDLDAVWTVSVWWEARVQVLRPEGDRIADVLRSAVADLRARYAEEVEMASLGAGRTPQVIADAIERATERAEQRWRVWVAAFSRTEATRLAGVAVLDSAAAARPGARKRWVAMPDDRVRHTHDLTDGDVIAVTMPFLVGGWPMMYPGDPQGPPQETVNCRCRLEIINA